MQEYLNQYEVIPFKVLQFLFTEINYGGRVTDAKDRRLINNLVLNFCNEDVLETGYSFSPSGVYSTPCVLWSPLAERVHNLPWPPVRKLFRNGTKNIKNYSTMRASSSNDGAMLLWLSYCCSRFFDFGFLPGHCFLLCDFRTPSHNACLVG
jgi:hypothetical protein